MKLLKALVDVLTNTLIGGAFCVGILSVFGHWQLVYVHWIKSNHVLEGIYRDERINDCDKNDAHAHPFRDYPIYWMSSMITAYGAYFLAGFSLHYYYYKLRRERPEEWKCQPQKWLSQELEQDEVKEGCKGLLIGNTWTSFLACYISNGGYYCNLYHKWNEYSLWYLLLQIPILFILEDYAVYWVHRIFHWPTLYKLFHSAHHKYRQPTAFSVTALHPIEITTLEAALVAPLFNPIFPIYLPVFVLHALYFYAMGILNHSGVDFKAQWWQPWQPESMFHDNHHQYFHVNFGFNLKWWDQLHGTIRKVDRIYTEKIFYGEGRAVLGASTEEREEDLRERRDENANAHPPGQKIYY